MNKSLTKYPFIAATRCEKSLWLNYFSPELKTPVTTEQQMVMDKGTAVGNFAWNLFPDGIDVSQGNTLFGKKLFDATQKAMEEDQQVFYEAGFETVCKRMNCKVDILIRSERSSKLIEVKSSTSIKEPQHILDLAFQYYVLTNSNYNGPKIEVYIAHLNKEYIREEELDIDDLFIVENVTRRIIDAQVLVKNYLQQFFKVLEEGKKCPDVKVSEVCFTPYRCPFFEHCWKDLPKTTVFNISRLRKSKATKLVAKGVIEPSQVPDDVKLSAEQWIEVDSYRSGKASIKRGEIKSFLDTLEMNEQTLWMDFETFMSPIPEFVGTRPYQQICFQYCVLIRNANSEIERKEFLAERGKDPRKSFIKHLLEDTKGKGNIIVYNQSFEIARMNELAKEFPEYKSQIEERISRIKDLLIPFAKKYYYHPLMNGSASIKAVLPVLVPEEETSYKNLSIKNGAMAMNLYERFHQLSLSEQIQTRRALLEYCHVDCLAMIEVAKALQNLL
jgi:hypothetical protein